MNTIAMEMDRPHPVDVRLQPALENRDRMTTAFRLILAIPHLILVGAPAAVFLSWTWGAGDIGSQWSSTGVLGAAAGICAMIAWFSILFTGRYPEGLRSLVEGYLRWRVRAVAYTALLRDEYPPFGDAPYPAELVLDVHDQPRDRVSVAFRLILAIPHILAVWLLGMAWCLATIIAWVMILMTGSYPEELYRFGVGVLRWNIRVEAYLLLLHDEYPPFTLG
jgi:anti-sigma factor RsiW